VTSASVIDTTLEVGLRWLREGRAVAVATLFEAEGSSPFAPGATMVVDADGNVEGSVTGGCVEGAVSEEATELLRGDGGLRILRYGISDELAGSVGLMCGGAVQIVVRTLGAEDAQVFAALLEARRAGIPAATATVLDGAGAGEVLALVGSEVVRGLDRAAALEPHAVSDVEGMLAQGLSGVRHFGADGARMGTEVRLFVDSRGTAPRLVVFGAVDFSAALAPLATAAGYRVTICDAREPFVRSERFRTAAEVVIRWPQDLLPELSLGPRDAVLVFTHDPKFDEPALLAALHSEAGYIGALGSRRTAADRERRLRAAGASDPEIERIYSPCGLDIGARSPEETAISVLAEIVAVRSGRGGGPLRAHRGPIHAR
jgi:xanthine dehydrogenase accessory factor